MGKDNVTFFEPYPFRLGQKIKVQSGPRKGDWEVIRVDDQKVKLRCPVSKREFEWHRFCYFIEEKSEVEWPERH